MVSPLLLAAVLSLTAPHPGIVPSTIDRVGSGIIKTVRSQQKAARAELADPAAITQYDLIHPKDSTEAFSPDHVAQSQSVRTDLATAPQAGPQAQSLVLETPNSLTHRPSWKSERVIAPTPGKTTTVIGNYKLDMKSILHN